VKTAGFFLESAPRVKNPSKITRQAGGFIPAVLSGGLFTAVLF
jgi:hypothetical protein